MISIERVYELRKIIEKAMALLDDAELSKGIELLPSLKYNGNLISNGTKVKFNSKIYKASVDLYDTEQNNPINAPTLWEEILYKNGIRIIPEFITVTTKFSKNELGYWNDTIYQSLVDNNVYNPEQYSQNWQIYIEE